MEKDSSDTFFDWADEDDILDRQTVHVPLNSKIPTILFGKETELTGIDPYLYVWFNCSVDQHGWKAYIVPIGESIYIDKKCSVVLNLDTGEAQISMKHAIF
ncbi:unnamed protein product [Caenorhabditis bovis]|uniref:Uncharacterized protein n=1 Tax=Caenorhabditis bovis TaxID=2654633 RepID=A0A8S1EKL7_9PELO|nr:unnamed protein product [Caenorhabditis bovis]